MAQDTPFEGSVTRRVRVREMTDGLIRPEMAAGELLVLLEEPGAEKTATIELVAGASRGTPPAEPSDTGTAWATGLELTNEVAFESIVGYRLPALPTMCEFVTPQGVLTMIFDQLD